MSNDTLAALKDCYEFLLKDKEGKYSRCLLDEDFDTTMVKNAIEKAEGEEIHTSKLITELLIALKLSLLIHDTVKSEYGPDPGQRMVIEAAIAKAEGV